MTTYRTAGAWGAGKGLNLTPAEVDNNFYDIVLRLSDVEDDPPAGVTPVSIAIDGTSFSMGLSDGSTLGPIVFALPMPAWRGAWTALTAYTVLNFFTAPDGALGAVLIAHTSAASFDWAAEDEDGKILYQNISGSSTGALSGLSDTNIDDPTLGQALVFDGDFWVNGDVGDVTGPASSVAGNIASFADDTGKELADTGIAFEDVVVGPVSAIAGNITIFVDENEIDDSGVAVADLVPRPSINTQAGTTYTLVFGDAYDIIEMSNGAANTLTVPANASVAFDIGTVISVSQTGAGTTTVEGAVGVTLNGVSGGSCDLNEQWAGISLYKRDTNVWVVQGAHGGVS